MAIFKATKENFSKAGELIKQGELVAFATETVYGLGANALSADACEKIFIAKERPHYDPLIVHIHDLDQLKSITAEIPPLAMKAAEKFWPGPLTMVLKKASCIPDLITANLDTVATRMPAHPVAQALLKAAGLPIAAPSANPFGYLSPTTAEHVEEQLGNKIPMVLDGGECDCGVESTIIDFSQGQPKLLRHGGIPREELEKVCGPIALGKAVLEKPLAPGQLASHYAPKTPLLILKPGEVPQIADGTKVGVLIHDERKLAFSYEIAEVIAHDDNLKEAAHNLFAALHRLDDEGLDVLYVYEFPESGLGCAIMDRLRKAAAKR